MQADKTLKETATAAEEMINQALAIDPTNALALHLHIHVAEASSPQRSVQMSPLSTLKPQCPVLMWQSKFVQSIFASAVGPSRSVLGLAAALNALLHCTRLKLSDGLALFNTELCQSLLEDTGGRQDTMKDALGSHSHATAPMPCCTAQD